MVPIAFTAAVGGISTFAALLPHGLTMAILGTPLGGSLSGSVLALYILYRRTAFQGRPAGSVGWVGGSAPTSLNTSR
jgi:hypothetical protein